MAYVADGWDWGVVPLRWNKNASGGYDLTVLNLVKDTDWTSGAVGVGSLNLVVGGVFPIDNSSTEYLAKWTNSSTPVVISLDLIEGPYPARPLYDISQDGRMILGYDRYWLNGVETFISNDGSMSSVSYYYGSEYGRRLSTDGHIFVGMTPIGPNVHQGCYWTDNLITILPPPSETIANYWASSCSADGSIISGGSVDATNINTSPSVACYWKNGEVRLLSTTQRTTADFVYSDGSVIYGYESDGMIYWSDLETTADGLIWGVLNLLEAPNPAYNWVYGICDNLIAGQPVAVGYANDDGYNQHAAIWHGTTLTFLMEPAGLVQDPSDIEGVAYAVSGDGSVVVGSYNYYDPVIGDWRYVPCWWDSNGVVHDLPPAAGPDQTYLGEAFGVDGDMIWGYGYATPKLTLAKIYPSQQPDNQYAFNGWNANFGYQDFSQLSIAMWCCKTVLIQGPFQYVFPSFQMAFRPDGASVYFKDINKNMLFSATFTNPGPVNDQYHIMFSVDTMAKTYSMYGNGIEWVSTDAAFPNAGLIYSGMS